MNRGRRLGLLAAGVLLVGTALLWAAARSEAGEARRAAIRERAVLAARGHGVTGEEARAIRTLLGDAARHLEVVAPPGAAVATFEGSLLAARLDRPVLDLGGIADRGVLEARRDGRLAELVARRAPRYLLSLAPTLEPSPGPAESHREGPGAGRDATAALLAHPSLRDHYRPVAYFTTDGGWRLVLHERHPLRFDVGTGDGAGATP